MSVIIYILQQGENVILLSWEAMIHFELSCPRAHNVPAPNKTCGGKLLIEEIAKS